MSLLGCGKIELNKKQKEGKATDYKIYYIASILVVFLAMATADAKEDRHVANAQISGEFAGTSENQSIRIKKAELLTQADENESDSIEKYYETKAHYDQKMRQMDEEFQALKKEEQQFNDETAEINKKRKRRSSRTIRQKKLLQEKRQKLNEKFNNYRNRKRALLEEIKAFNEMMKQKFEAQTNP